MAAPATAAGQAHGSTKAYLIAAGVLAVIASWATAHTVFTLRHARTYDRGRVGGIDVNEDEPPAYLDFACLSFTIGMTFQVSDTELTTSRYAVSPSPTRCCPISSER